MSERLSFFKMSGAGNDFLVADNRHGEWDAFDLPKLARGLCRRALSVGADGLILLEPSARAAYALRILNRDGSASPMCGNGARCAARFAALNGAFEGRTLFEAGGHLLSAELLPSGDVRVELPGKAAAPRRVDVSLEGRLVQGFHTDSGVPHFVLFVRDLKAVPVQAFGRALRFAPEMGEGGANVDFVSAGTESPFAMRTYERGVEGETLACGTGATAVAWVLHSLGKAGRAVKILAASGKELLVEIDPDPASGNPFRLSGEARVVYEGHLSPESIQEALACSAAV